MGKLYIVPTPVGNMEDVTARALRVLREADLILAEDTRTTGQLLAHHGIRNTLRSHHMHNEHRAVEGILALLRAGQTIAQVSDAGTPGISDPGFLLAREAAADGHEVTCLPGATACVPAVVMSGLPCDRFCFEGFLPPKKGRATRLAEIAADPRTTIIYESPRRVAKTLVQLAEACGGDRPACVCREISKLHEECVRGSLQELAARFAETEARGECVIVVGGCPSRKVDKHTSI